MGPSASAAAGSTFTAAGSFSDNLPGPFAATVDYGDGSGPSPLAPAANGSFALAHVYARSGV